MNLVRTPPGIVRWTKRLEETQGLDVAVRAVEPTVQAAFGAGSRASVLRGEWLGHAVHPILTDLVIGSWTSASLLDLLGGRAASGPAQKLLGIGLVAAAPTFWTGWAEWTTVGQREKRVGIVHAVTNGTALSAYAASWLARRRGEHRRGVKFALAGAAVSGFGAYLGGHLAIARKVGSHDPAYAPSPGG
jgi:hypothetical protein